MSHNDQNESAAETRRSIVSASQRIAELEAERNTLEEVCDDLQMRENNLSQRLSSAREENVALADRIKVARQRSEELAQQVGVVEISITGLERQAGTDERRVEALRQELQTLTEQVGSHHGQASKADLSLRTIRESVLSMDQKLAFARRKRALKLQNQSLLSSDSKIVS